MKNIQLINKITEQIINEFTNSKTPLYPYYYMTRFQEIAHEINDEGLNSIIKSKPCLFNNSLDNELLDIYSKHSHESLSQVQSINSIFKDQTNKGFLEITKITNDNDVLNTISSFKDKVSSTLKDADLIIEKLKIDIKTLEDENNIDHLTKSFNKRVLSNDLKNILEFGQDKNLDMSLLILDVDDFKKINDNYGHLVGDKVLIFLARLIKNCVRRGTRVYRFGGEEFIVILNRIEFKDAKEISKKIVADVAKSKLSFKDGIINITLSGGLASHKAGDTYESIIERADKALYEVKKSGKNRVEVV